MATYEHADARGDWFFQALVESPKLNQMSINDEAAHRNKPQARIQRETGAEVVGKNTIDESYMLILQGVATVGFEAAWDAPGPTPNPPDVVNVYVPYPTGPGLAPFLYRPVPVVHAMRIARSVRGETLSPTTALYDYQNADMDADYTDRADFWGPFSPPEALVGFTGLDSGTDFRTSLVITVTFADYDATFTGSSSVSGVDAGGFVFWRTIGHIAAH